MDYVFHVSDIYLEGKLWLSPNMDTGELWSLQQTPVKAGNHPNLSFIYLLFLLNSIPCGFRMGYKCPATFNPADFFVYTLAVVPGHETRSRNKIRTICNQFALSEEGSRLEDSVQAQHSMTLRLDADYSSCSDSGVINTNHNINWIGCMYVALQPSSRALACRIYINIFFQWKENPNGLLFSVVVCVKI